MTTQLIRKRARNAMTIGMPGLFTARRALGLTQGEVGELIGKSQAHYGKIENGCVELSAKDALALCSYFGITIQELMKGMK